MMTYQDLVFEPHDAIAAGFLTRASMYFPNGYGVSVITGPATYGGLELAVMKGKSDEDSALCYDTEITDDVLGYQTPETITEFMARIQQLPEDK